MDWGLVALAALTGYLVGSISFARIIGRLVRPGADVTRMEVTRPDGTTFTLTSASASAVRTTLGRRWGVTVALLDMGKAVVVTLAFRLVAPEQPAWLVAGVFTVVGHDLPLYHRFRGGRGESPMLGVLLVIDPLFLVASLVTGSLVGFVVGNLLVLRWAGFPVMAIILLVAGRPAEAVAALAMLGIYFVALVPELRQYAAMIRGGSPPSNEEIAVTFAMGASLGRAMDRHSPAARLGRRRSAGTGSSGHPARADGGPLPREDVAP